MSTVSRRQFIYSLGALGSLACTSTLVGLAASANAGGLQKRTETKLQMGTFVTITAYSHSRDRLDEAIAKAFQMADEAEKVFTRHESSSPLGVLNAQGVVYDAPIVLISLLKDSLRLTRQTDRGFNSAIVPVLDALSEFDVASVVELPRSVRSELDQLTNPGNVIVKGDSIRLANQGMRVSLDGIAKGHIVDLMAAKLERLGVSNYLINAGGDIRVGPIIPAGQTWNVAIQDATNPSQSVKTIPLRGGAMATSANYESLATKGYDHLVSMEAGQKASHTSVSVTAPTCAEADSLATALFAMGMEKGMRFVDLQPAYACLWQTNAGVFSSANWA